MVNLSLNIHDIIFVHTLPWLISLNIHTGTDYLGKQIPSIAWNINFA